MVLERLNARTPELRLLFDDYRSRSRSHLLSGLYILTYHTKPPAHLKSSYLNYIFFCWYTVTVVKLTGCINLNWRSIACGLTRMSLKCHMCYVCVCLFVCYKLFIKLIFFHDSAFIVTTTSSSVFDTMSQLPSIHVCASHLYLIRWDLLVSLSKHPLESSCKSFSVSPI